MIHVRCAHRHVYRLVPTLKLRYAGLDTMVMWRWLLWSLQIGNGFPPAPGDWVELVVSFGQIFGHKYLEVGHKYPVGGAPGDWMELVVVSFAAGTVLALPPHFSRPTAPLVFLCLCVFVYLLVCIFCGL